jgi:hypothetical protein
MKWIVLGLVLAGAILNLIASFVLADPGTKALAAVVSILMLAAPGLYNLFAGETRAEESREERRRREIQDKLEYAVDSLFAGEKLGTIRANIMLPDDDSLLMVHTWNMDTWQDRGLRLASGEGVAGAVWENANGAGHANRWRPIVAKEITEANLETWNVSREVAARTRHVRWIVSIPILEAGTMAVLGVLNFDGLEPLTNPALLDSRAFYDRFAAFAEVMAALLS